jgi:hypothetical protein
LLAAIGVIISLIYLAIQIRQNTKAVKATAYQDSVAASRDLNLAVLTNPELSELALREDAIEVASGEDRRRMSLLLNVFLKNFESQFYQYQQGLLEDHLWSANRANLCRLATRPGFAMWWQQTGLAFSPGFKALVDGFLQSSDRNA